MLAVAEPELSFAGLLRQLRAGARLTQEELAEAASLSPQAVAALERGVHRTARKDTAVLLADALGLPEQVRAVFVAAARGKAPAAGVLSARQGVTPGGFAAAVARALPRDIAAFTGRQAELAQLMGALAETATSGGVVGIHAIGGMAGVGKTTFAVHAAHRLADAFPDGQFFLPLHAHTAGQRPVDPADALASLLLTAGVPAAQIPPGLEARAARWRDYVAGKKILLLLDDASGHEQVRPLLPGTAGSLVLVTSRRRLSALEDATVISLDTLTARDAAVLLVRLAARPGLQAGDIAAGGISRLCGYLPLAIGMLASQLRHHPAWDAASLAADLAAARDLLALMRAENVSVAAAFGLSYRDLGPDQQQLFRRLGLVPGPTVDGYAAAALVTTDLGTARRLLGELYDHHLLTEPARGRYLLHDLLREHARALVTADDPAESDAAVGRLLDYYLHTTLTAGRHILLMTVAQGQPPPGDPPACVPGRPTLDHAAAWLETERPNLQAAADLAAVSGRHLHAIQIPAAMGDFLRSRGHWEQSAVLHRTALEAARRAGDRPGQALALRQLGILAWLTGDLPAAAASLIRAAALYGEAGDQPGQAYALDQLGVVRQWEGEYAASAVCRQQALALARMSGDRLAEAAALHHLSLIQGLTGQWAAATTGVEQALALVRVLGYPEFDMLHTLGCLQRETGDYLAAAVSLEQALDMMREFGERPFRGTALDDLGRVQQLTGDYAAALTSHTQALALHRELGYRLGEAEALNSLGELSTRTSATGQARDYHTQALAIARSVGLPMTKACALEGIGRSHLQDGEPGPAAGYLQQALTIYQHIGVPGARHVRLAIHPAGLRLRVQDLWRTPYNRSSVTPDMAVQAYERPWPRHSPANGDGEAPPPPRTNRAACSVRHQPAYRRLDKARRSGGYVRARRGQVLVTVRDLILDAA
jgi:tetratricopeptide (TPR) repeat protein/transcriptional regulator with XRE-family HTH domain